MAEAQVNPPGLSTTNAEVRTNSYSSLSLTNLTAQATLKYSVKDYDAAAELYSQATELQAKINGEMSPQNADLLYAYGRCLYHVAVMKSDVLGSKIAGERPEGSKKPQNQETYQEGAVSMSVENEKTISKENVPKFAEGNVAAIKPEDALEKAKKPYFQFTGDENWDTSDEEEDEDDQDRGDGGDADEEDDFVNAYEVLDLARILLLNKLGDVESAAGLAEGESQEVRHLKERLADTYDLQAEISLEGERFPAAVVDLKSALKLKLALFPQESSLLAEAHYKLSLALEFSSVTQQRNETGEIDAGNGAHVDEAMREEAVHQMESAIASCKLRMQKEEASLSKGRPRNGCTKKSKATKKDIEDVKEMIKEMEQRVVELRQSPISFGDPRGIRITDDSNPLTNILGSNLGEDTAAQMARLEEAMKGAQDLTNRVRRKGPAESGSLKSPDPESNATIGKRKNGITGGDKDVSMRKKAKNSNGDDG